MGDSEWTHEQVIRLIQEYAKYPELWNPSHDSYRVKTCNEETWKEIAHTFDCDVTDLRKKLNSLLASYRRERGKVRAGGTSTWFLYDHMSFHPTHIDTSNRTDKSHTDNTIISRSTKINIGIEKTLQFIELVQKEPCLWDRAHKAYYMNRVRNAATERIARELNSKHFEAKHVVKKFQFLRSSYCRELKNIHSMLDKGLGEKAIHFPKPVWFSKMDSFMRPQLPQNFLPVLDWLDRNKKNENELRETLHHELMLKTEEQSSEGDVEDDMDGLSEGDNLEYLPALFWLDKNKKKEELETVHREIEEQSFESDVEENMTGPSDGESSKAVDSPKVTSFSEELEESVRQPKEPRLDQPDNTPKVRQCRKQDRSEELDQLKSDAYDAFGRYVAAMLRAQPARARTLQPKIVALLTSQDFGEDDPHVSQSDETLPKL